MKPRTELEKRVVSLSEYLPLITTSQEQWAKKHCFERIAYRCKNEMWCTVCGGKWIDATGQKKGYITCPHCGVKLKVNVSTRKNLSEASYMTIVTISEEFQVLRHIYIRRYRRENHNNGEVFYFLSEVCQQWFSLEHRELVISRPLNMFNNAWKYEEPMTLKKEKCEWYSNYNKYNINGWVYPSVKLLPILRRNGLRTSFHDITPASLVRALLNNDVLVETLLKTRQYDLIRYRFSHYSISYKWAINICNRNRYIVKDASMWQDYLHLLTYFNLDTHNAHYVCPKNLKVEHDRLKRRKEKHDAENRRRMIEEDRRKNIENLKNDIHEFIQRIRPFLGMEIRGQGIVIRPLESVTQFYVEGKAMHHCVYTMKYYSRPDCLILSAQKEGKRLETIEVSLKTFNVVQSRSVCNKISDYHDRILNLMKDNMWMIRNRAS